MNLACRTSVRTMILTLPWLAALGLPAGAADALDGPADQPAATTEVAPRPRAVVWVNRNREVAGYVQWEDADFLLLEKLDGTTETFTKSRVARVVHLVEPKTGQVGIVYLRDGQTRQGVVLDDGFDAVVVEIDGIRTVLARADVDYIALQPTFDEQYQQYRDAVKTPQQRFQMCQWLVAEQQYRIAETELASLIEQHPMAPAMQLMRVVQAQLALMPAETPAGDPGPAPGDDEEDDDGLEPRLPVISRADVNLMRVYEIDFDRPPRVQVGPDAIGHMIERYADSRLIPEADRERRALYRAEPLQVVSLLFQLRARDLYPEIEVLTEPYALNLFRQRVHNGWLMNSCATARCHGGPAAGRFLLVRRHYKDERVRYTNLLILERLQVDPEWPLINYDEPKMSLIVQYGLPRQEARRPHPDVRGWKPVFGAGGQRLLEESLEWIESMMQPRPLYPVAYEPPSLAPPGDDGEPAGPFGEPEPPRVPR